MTTPDATSIRPPPATSSGDWFALHVFLSEPTRSNRFLVEWAAPQVRDRLISGRAQSWFYVRYWEGGPHLRLRLKGLSAVDRAALLTDIQAAVGPYLNPEPPGRDAFYGAHGFDGRPVDAATLAWHDEGAVVALPYEPEWQRYGGDGAMQVNEQLFDLSSTLATALVRASLTDPMRRMALAASVMPEFALAWRADVAAVADFFETYAGFWLGYSAATRAFAGQMEAQAAAPSAAQQTALAQQIAAARDGVDGAGARAPQALLRAGLKDAMGHFTSLHAQDRLVLPLDGRLVRSAGAFAMAVQSMLSSQVHMFNNRLGLVPAQEVVLARGIARTARALQAQSQSTPTQVLQ
jgi:hypothetical protein